MKKTIELHKRWKDDPSKGEVFTPQTLVEEMLDKIPDSVWENPASTFMDPCMGKGTFLIDILRRLTTIYGYSVEDAMSRIYGYDVRVKYINYLKRGGFKNIFHKDFLNENIDMKFDVIVGNPPYQSGNNKGNKLWIKFINKSMELSNNICYVVPLSLMTSESKQIVDLRKKMVGKENVFNLTKKDIFNVGEKVVYFSSVESENNQTTIVFSETKSQIIQDITKRQPVDVDDDIKLSIFNKIENNTEKNDYVFDFNRNSNQTTPSRLISKGLVSKTQDDVFRYPVHHSASQMLYSRVLVSEYSKDNETTYGKLKVVLNYSGGFIGDKYMFLSRNMIGKQMFGIVVDNEEQGNNLISAYSSKLFSWYISTEKSGGFNSGIYKLPKMDKTKSWTDDEIYDFFGLTLEEREYVNNYDL
jgi:hypothetical protein